jgi:hypothetical protein
VAGCRPGLANPACVRFITRSEETFQLIGELAS